MAMSGPRCETCRYWRSAEGIVGACRRYPPASYDDERCYWPSTVAYDWCGEWLERDPQPWDVEQR